MTYEIYSKDDNDRERNYSTPEVLRKMVTSYTMIDYFDNYDGSLEVQILHKPTGAVGNFCLGDCKDFDRYIQPFIEECEATEVIKRRSEKKEIQIQNECRAIRDDLKTQNNRMTNAPMFCVFEVVEIGEKDHEGRKHVYQKIEMMREVFFTQREADEYIEECAHEHDGKLFVYVKSGKNNKGWIFARASLMNLTDKQEE